MSAVPARNEVDAVIARAEHLCVARAQRFTAMRRRVLRCIAEAARPLGAYDIMADLAEESRKIAPPTVYRALDFLQAQGLIHRVHSENAFVVCALAGAPHSAALLICSVCNRVREVPCHELEGHVLMHAAAFDFVVDGVVVEVRGRCRECARR